MPPVSVRRLAVAVLAVALVSGAIGPAFPTGGTESARPGIAAGAGPDSGGPVLAATTPADNGSIRHEDPEEASEDGDLAGVQSWLLGRVSERLGASTRNISRGQYDAAAASLDNETRAYLDQFVDVTSDTDAEDDDRVAVTINETIEEQRDFAQTQRNYSETYEAYLAARDDGNITRARRLARELAELERRLSQTGTNITRNYRTIENTTGTDTDEEAGAINRSAQNTSQVQSRIRQELFNETRVEITSHTPDGSALDPLVIRGRVVMANGTPVTEGVIGLRGGLNVTASLDATGRFTLRHRPILLQRGTTNLTLQYRPPVTSPYLGSSREIAVTIREHEPTLELMGVPDSVGFGENLSVTARVTVGTRSIQGVPIEVTLEGVRLRSNLMANGTTKISGAVPARVDDGRREVRVTLPISGRAIASANATRTLLVRETETRLTTDVTVLSPTRVRIRGQLETTGGRPVPEQSIRLRIGGEEAGSTLTNATGAFGATLTVPEEGNASALGDRRVAVNATFAAPSTNLGAARAGQTIPVPSGLLGEEGGLLGLGFPAWLWVALVALVLAVTVAGYAVLSRRGEQSEGMTGTAAEAPGTGVPPETGAESRVSPSLLAVATERLEGGAPDAATEAGYEAVRQRLADRLGVVAGTHWELYRACQGAGWPEERTSAVRRLIEAYEQAAFAPGSLSAETAREALATARDLLEEDDVVSSGD
ncbi:MAG: hypothetical protein ABEH66_05180 [Halobacteriales archaeon]